ncbi:uncharacterized protein LOC133184150 [Saccostrea echinata]|uniref:uncharacterized protein LOC133184150 n=1 Tax=Saccostrea echinata TaxID=191078 RepID=UPI002A8112B4|nr:uncharacterized protein LOC133184150 [Saccostrea echinata]
MNTCSSFIHLFVLLYSTNAAAYSGDETSPAGNHCVNYTRNHENQTECTLCFFPQNCLTNNTCKEGTKGNTCEQCTSSSEGYAINSYRIGNTCISCEAMPVTTVAFGIYVILFIMAVITNGFSGSLCTKLKVICHFLQMLYLTFLIKIQWPVLIQKTVMSLAFVTFNSNIIPLKCLIPSLSFLSIHYLEWTSSFLIVIIIILITFLVDRSLQGTTIQNKTGKVRKQKKWHYRVTFLRMMFFVTVAMYMPITLSVAHSSLCSGIIPAKVTLNAEENVFFYLQEESCDQIIFQNIQFIGTIFLIFYVLLFPVLIVFISLRQKKWKLLSKVNQVNRPLYESYHPRCCFWEAFPMIRKLISISVTDIYPLSIFIQCLIQLSTTSVYFILLILLRPYRSVVWGSRKTEIHTFFEILSTLTVGLMQSLPLLMTLGTNTPTLEYLILGCIGLTLLIGVIMIFLTPVEKEEGITPSNGNLGSSSESLHSRHNKVAPAPITYEEVIQERRRHLEF